MTTQDYSPNRTKRLNILLGVTGSVAAVKAPKVAVELSKLGHHVRVLLSAGGTNFWSKAKDYDNQSWEDLQEVLNSSSPSIRIHGT